jgi:hypothetical protein
MIVFDVDAVQNDDAREVFDHTGLNIDDKLNLLEAIAKIIGASSDLSFQQQAIMVTLLSLSRSLALSLTYSLSLLQRASRYPVKRHFRVIDLQDVEAPHSLIFFNSFHIRFSHFYLSL